MQGLAFSGGRNEYFLNYMQHRCITLSGILTLQLGNKYVF